MRRGHFSFHLSLENTCGNRGAVCLNVCVSALEEAVSEGLEAGGALRVMDLRGLRE